MTRNERTRKERGSTQQPIDDCSVRIGRVALAAYLGSLVDSFVHVELIDDLGIVFVVNLEQQHLLKEILKCDDALHVRCAHEFSKQANNQTTKQPTDQATKQPSKPRETAATCRQRSVSCESLCCAALTIATGACARGFCAPSVTPSFSNVPAVSHCPSRQPSVSRRAWRMKATVAVSAAVAARAARATSARRDSQAELQNETEQSIPVHTGTTGDNRGQQETTGDNREQQGTTANNRFNVPVGGAKYKVVFASWFSEQMYLTLFVLLL